MPRPLPSGRLPGVHLQRTEENVREIDALAGLCPRVGVAGVLGDLDRRARRTWAPGLRVRRALTWDRHDNGDRTWWPQGVTNSYRTEVSQDVLLVAWYSKAGEGSRVTVLDLASRRYRHVLLVEPTLSADGVPGVRPVRAHAGGIVWQAPYLHVAATRKGFLTFRLDDLLRVPEWEADSPRVETLGYRYVLPVRFAYRAAAEEGVERLRFSFLSLDRSGAVPALVVGEYGRGKQTRRLARFPVDPATGLLEVGDDGCSRPVTLDEDGPYRAQGATFVDGRLTLTSSMGPWTPGTVWVGRYGDLRAHRWATPPGPEDICWWPDHGGRPGRLWSVTEHPHRRWVFSMKPF